jgi:hypothetical protein
VDRADAPDSALALGDVCPRFFPLQPRLKLLYLLAPLVETYRHSFTSEIYDLR